MKVQIVLICLWLIFSVDALAQVSNSGQAETSIVGSALIQGSARLMTSACANAESRCRVTDADTHFAETTPDVTKRNDSLDSGAPPTNLQVSVIGPGVPVPPKFFFIHYSQTSTLFPDPSYSFGGVRLWDTQTGWGDMQYNANCNHTVTSGCNFSSLDAWVSKFGPAEQIILTIGKTPSFISRDNSYSCSYYSGACLPPTDIACDGTGSNATWIGYITALFDHINSTYPGRITYVEVWNEWNVAGMYALGYINQTLCPTTTDAGEKILIRMTQDVQCILHAVNCNTNGVYAETGIAPSVLVIGPPVDGPGIPSNQSYLPAGPEYQLLQDGIGNYVDVISTHGYVGSSGGETASNCSAPSNSTCAYPENIDSAIKALQTTMSYFGVNKPVAVSEFSWGPQSGTTDAQYEQAFVGRAYTLMAQDGVSLAGWYSLDGKTNICNAAPILISNFLTGTECATGAAVQVIQSWIAGAVFLQSSYTKTPRSDCASGSNIYEFPVMLANGTLARIVYYDGIADTANCTYLVPALGFISFTDMTGAIHSLSGVSSILLDNRPILLGMSQCPGLGDGCSIAGLPKLPQTWVDNNEATDGLAYTAPQYELNLGREAWVTGPPAGCMFHIPYWTVGAPTFAGLQSAVNDAEACRTATGAGMFVDIPPALYTTTNANGLVLPQTNTAQAAAFIVLRSTGDSYLPAGQTVCAHGIQDNLSTSTDIGLVNPDCTGQNMYYQLGPQNSSNVAGTPGTISGITTLSTNTTTLAAITASATAQCVMLANGYVAAGVAEVVDTGTNQETVTTTSAANQTGMCGVFTKNHAAGVTVQFCAGGCSYTLANGTAINTANYNDLEYMWQVQSSGANPAAVTFCNPSSTAIAPTCSVNVRPDHWMIEDMAASMAAGNTGNNFVVDLTHNATAASQLAKHIHFRKDWVHGDWTSLATGANFVSAALELGDCQYCSVVDNQISQILRPAAECHGISANGTTYKIVHNWIEGCSIGMLSGGYSASGPPISGWLSFQDVEVRRNRFTYPYAWLGQSPIANGVNTACCNSAWSSVRKNSFEIKEGARVLEVGNIGEDVDNAGVQNGIGSDWNTWNASGGGSGSNYQAEETDLTFANNILRNTCTGFEMQGAGRNQGGVTLPFERGVWSQNLLYSVTRKNPGCSNADDYAFNFESALNQWQGTVTENANGTATFTANCSVYQGTCIGQVASGTIAAAGSGCTGNGSLTISAPNLAWGIQAAGTYKCTGGALTAVTITNNGTGYTSVPTAAVASGTGTVTLTINTASTAPQVGFQQLDFIAGQSLWVTQCPATAFNMPSLTKGGFLFPTSLGPQAVAGTNPASLSVTYAWTGPAPGTSDTSGYCMISNFPGMPYNVQFTHNTTITDAEHSISSTNSALQNNGPNYEQNARFQDDIILGGGFYNNALGAGCNTINWNFDPNSFTVDHMVLPGVTTSYSACLYGNNPYFPVSTPVLYEPTTPYCTGATPDGTCVGFAGAMSTSSMPLTLPDYHQYALLSISVFASGGTAAASDGTAMGANITALDGAQTATQYVCQYSCGIAGPFNDLPSF